MRRSAALVSAFSFLLLCPVASATTVPTLLIKGYGPKIAKLNKVRRFLVDDGFADKDIHSLDYDQKAEPETLRKSAESSLDAILSKYPAGTEFDVISHSLGGFVGLYTILQSKHAARLRKYVSLASIARGQETLAQCERFDCGETIEALLPFFNPFVKSFFDTHAKAFETFEKCSLFSPEDNIVHDPADSGVLPGGIAVEVRDATHWDFIWDRDLYNIMRVACYGAAKPRKGFEHRWRVIP